MQGRDLVEEQIAALVELTRTGAGEQTLHRERIERLARPDEFGAEFQQAQQAPRIAIGGLDQQPSRRLGHLQSQLAESALRVAERPLEHARKIGFIQGPEPTPHVV